MAGLSLGPLLTPKQLQAVSTLPRKPVAVALHEEGVCVALTPYVEEEGHAEELYEALCGGASPTAGATTGRRAGTATCGGAAKARGHCPFGHPLPFDAEALVWRYVRGTPACLDELKARMRAVSVDSPDAVSFVVRLRPGSLPLLQPSPPPTRPPPGGAGGDDGGGGGQNGGKRAAEGMAGGAAAAVASEGSAGRVGVAGGAADDDGDGGPGLSSWPIVGTVSLLACMPSQLRVELGYIILCPAVQRTPVATAATYLLASHAFGIGFRRFEWKTHTSHARSRAAALRSGFAFEGVFRCHMVLAQRHGAGAGEEGGVGGAGADAPSPKVSLRSRDTAWFSIVDRRSDGGDQGCGGVGGAAAEEEEEEGTWPAAGIRMREMVVGETGEALFARRAEELASLRENGTPSSI